jgi:hypothetical protein
LTLFEERKTIRMLPQPLERGTDRKKKKTWKLAKAGGADRPSSQVYLMTLNRYEYLITGAVLVLLAQAGNPCNVDW